MANLTASELNQISDNAQPGITESYIANIQGRLQANADGGLYTFVDKTIADSGVKTAVASAMTGYGFTVTHDAEAGTTTYSWVTPG